MKTPNYIITPLKRAEFYFGKDCVPGYSIKIHKHTKYEYCSTLLNRCHQIITWCNKQVEGSAELVFCPKLSETKYTDQYAVINIYDPVMLHLEQFIKAAAR